MATDNTGSTPDSKPAKDTGSITGSGSKPATPASETTGASAGTSTSVASKGTPAAPGSETSTAQNTVSFRASYPLNLFAHNGKNQTVMFITSQVGENQLYIEITNNSGSGYKIPALDNDTVSASNYQIELRFRPGTLDEHLVSGIKIDQSGWSLIFAKQSDGSQSLYIMSSEALQWPSQNSAVSFTLSGFPVSGTGGSRVTRIELRYTNLQSQDSANPLSGTRTQVMQIVEHAGTNECPFLFSVNGLGDLLNDGKTKNTVSFVLQTKTGESIPVNQETKFILSFITLPERQTNGNSIAIATEDNFTSSVPGKLSDADWGISKSSDQGIATEYILSPASGTTSFTTLTVPLTDLVTNQPNGRTPVSLKYQNVPGYWDGELTLWLEKSPLVRKLQKVGMGTASPGSQLDIQGSVNIANGATISNGNLTVDGDIISTGSLEANQLHSSGSPNGLEIGNFKNNDASQFPNVIWLRNLSSDWDEGIIKVGKSQAHFSRGGFGMHTNENREVGFYTTNYTPMLMVEGGTGNTYIKGMLGVGVEEGKPDDSTSASVSMPYPNGTVIKNGLQVGNSQTANNQFAGVFVAVDQNSQVYPLLINDSDGKPLFGVKPNDNGDVSPGAVGINQYPTNDSIFALPYPAGSSVNGILIGDSQTGNGYYAGLFISMPEDAEGSPIQINDSQGNTPFIVTTEGNIGIGTNNITKAKLQIEGSVNSPVNSYAWLCLHDVPVGKVNGNNTGADYSIYASNRVVATEFDATSDARIKNIVGITDSAGDLAILDRIEITDYQYVDIIQHGTRSHKKVIGQQLAKVFPQAVTKNTDVVPDIFKKSVLRERVLNLGNTDVQAGDKLKVIFEDDSSELLEVKEVNGDRVTLETEKEGNVFVYGREVEDFHNVDYDAISMLNVSATQELHKLIQKQNEAIETLQKRVEELEGK